MQQRFSKSLIAILIATVFMSVVSLPDSIKASLPNDPVSTWIKKQKISLGLDLQGGTQLDYRVDLRSAKERNEDDDASNDVVIHDVIEGVLATVERRVNGLGVSEPQIYTSKVAGEEHIIVELAGIKDIDEAKEVVGKTIQLEFKEQKTEADPDELKVIEGEANTALERVKAPDADFTTIGESLQTSDGKIEFRKEKGSFVSDLSNHYRELLPTMRAGSIHPAVLDGSGEFIVSGGGTLTEKKTLVLVQLIGKESREKEETEPEKVRASHILISYAGAERAPETVTRTKEEAKKIAEELLPDVQAEPDHFADFAKNHSDGPSGPNGGDLDFFGRGVMSPTFEQAAFAMEVETISEVVESTFGFHIIKVTDRQEESTSSTQEDFYTYNEIVFDATPDPWKSTGLDGAHFRYASVTYDQIGSPQVTIEFDSEGATLFEELTERLVNQPLAIFVGGQLISAPTVNQKITGGNAVITGSYSLQEALQMANDLNTGAIDAPIILSGQHTISATLGENALRVSLIAGVLGLVALALFMIAYYRLLGLLAVLALLIYAIIIIFLLKTMPLVMTLAGIAGIILSIGMAVDANILIFERTKEELNEGKNFITATATGFERAWSSIRDSNVSSLITCAILWFFGNSIIKGFAIMLGIGILISMFTAINVTQALLRTLYGSKISKNMAWLGVKKARSSKR